MSGLWEALVKALHEHEYADGGPADECRCGVKLDTLTTCVIQRHQADAVLRVLAEHGGTQQVREEVWNAIGGYDDDRVDRVMAVVVPLLAARDAANERATVAQAIRDAAFRDLRDEAVKRGVAEADLVAARQQLDQVRELAEEFNRISTKYGNEYGGYPEANAFNNAKQDAYDYASDRLLAILDAPARPTGHDETGQ